jgi:hypothetical protein
MFHFLALCGAFVCAAGSLEDATGLVQKSLTSSLASGTPMASKQPPPQGAYLEPGSFSGEFVVAVGDATAFVTKAENVAGLRAGVAALASLPVEQVEVNLDAIAFSAVSVTYKFTMLESPDKAIHPVAAAFETQLADNAAVLATLQGALAEMNADAVTMVSSWTKPIVIGAGLYRLCDDMFVNWTSSLGATCENHIMAGWCSYSGGYGAGWIDGWGTFEDYNSSGLTAVNVCCGCGGGNITTLNANIVDECNDVHGWMSESGSRCDAYVGSRWCTHEGGYGTSWKPEWGTFDDWRSNATGASALDACCGCGGGVKVCRDTNFTSSADSTCDMYEEKAWCTATGGVGVNWMPT